MGYIQENPICIVSQDTCVKVAKKDADVCSSVPKRYVQRNSLSYYVLLNTWFHLLKTVSTYGWYRILDRCVQEGLISVIRSAQEASDCVLHGFPLKDPMWEEVQREVNAHYDNFARDNRLHPTLNIGRDPKSTFLFLLRYPKRFTPQENDVIQQQALSEFVAFENRTKMVQRQNWSPIYIDWVRSAVNDCVDWRSVMRDLQDISGDFVYSSGTGTDAEPTIGSKFAAMYERGEYGNIPLFHRPETITFSSGSYENEPMHTVKVLAVPKSYKASRIIAMEDTYRQAYAKRVSLILRRYTPSCIDVTDQTRNQELARIGSRTGEYATLDLSHGSDAVSTRLVREIFPAEFVRFIFPLMGTHNEVDGKVRLTQTFSTAGHSLTFDIETIVFYAIVKAACEVVSRFTDYSYLEPSVYGDDIIVDTKCAQEAIYLLEYFGFIINKEKSFMSPVWRYRESCGEEYLEGISMTSLYYPRFPIVGSVNGSSVTLSGKIHRDGFTGKISDSTTMLIDLQHKLYPVCYPASRFIFELVRSAYPELTFSPPGSLSTDLWELGDSCISRKFPRGEFLPDGTLRYLPSAVPEFSGYYKTSYEGKCAELIECTIDGVDFVHSTPVIQYCLDADQKKLSDKYFDLYKYYEFLRTGPRYRDELARLLGVTEAPVTPEMIFGKPVFTWKLRG